MELKNFSLAIGYWRGIAALSILILHFFPTNSSISWLWVATDTFFILSGYQFMKRNGLKPRFTFNYKVKLIVGRILALLPLLACSIVFRASLIIIELLKENFTGHIGLKSVHLLTQFSYLAASFFCVQFLHPISIQIFVPLWFITVYFWIYVFSASVSVTHSLRRVISFIFLGFMLFQISLNLSSDTAGFEVERKWIFLFARGIIGFGLGMMVSLVLDFKSNIWISIIFLLCLLLISVVPLIRHIPSGYFIIETDSIFCIFLTYLLRREKKLAYLTSNIQKLGFFLNKYSYGIYLLHPLLLILIPKNFINSHYRSEALLILIASSIGLSYLLTNLSDYISRRIRSYL